MPCDLVMCDTVPHHDPWRTIDAAADADVRVLVPMMPMMAVVAIRPRYVTFCSRGRHTHPIRHGYPDNAVLVVVVDAVVVVNYVNKLQGDTMICPVV